MRYFLGIYDAAGYLYKIGKGLEANGNTVRYVNVANDRYKYSESKEYNFSRRLEEVATKYPSRSLIRLILYPFIAAARLFILGNELFRSDVFVFSGIQSFFDFYDLPLLRLFRKKIIVIYIGSDARPTYLSGKHLDDHNSGFIAKRSYLESKKIKSRIARVEMWSDYIVNHVGTAQFFVKKCVMFSYLGIPYDMALLNQTKSNNHALTDKIRILHAPSRPKAKGSEVFKQIVSDLKMIDGEIDYIEITNKTNSEVIAELQKCDIVLDELYSDMPLATFGVEASILKKPLIVGGYFSRYISQSIPKDAIPPVLYVAPELIKTTLINLIKRREDWQLIEENQHSYVVNNYSPSVVASKLELLAVGKVPKEYWFSPQDSDYIHGWGLSEEQLKTQLRLYIDELGVESLLLDHNVKLRNHIVQFCSA